MKILQTLGRHGGAQEGVSQYRRTAEGVFIDSRVGQANLDTPQITVTTEEWTAILSAIRNNPNSTSRLTGVAPFDEPPNTSLYELLSQTVPDPQGGRNWHDSWEAYVCAILEHEGSIDLCHGTLGPRAKAIICFARDV